MNTYARDYGLVSDPERVQTALIQQAIDDCWQSGGGIVYFEPGLYRTGTVYLRSNTCLHLPPACTLKGSDDISDYNAGDAWPQNMIWPPEYVYGQHLIVGLEVENCGICGGGTIDGNGLHFGYRAEPDFVRPGQMVYLCECTGVTLDDLRLVNSTYWSCFVHGCENVIITRLRIKNNAHISNGDGIDIDTSRRVVVSDCIIQTEDDCITFRCDNGFFSKLKDTTRILEDVTVTNCQLETKGCNAFRIGVGNGKIRNCQVSNIVIRNSSKGVCMESRYSFNDDERPGVSIENISFQNIYMECRIPVFLSSSCFGINDFSAPAIRNIRFSGLTVRAQHNIVIQGTHNAAPENIVFRDMFLDMEGVPKCEDKYGYGEWDYLTSPAAFYIANAKGVLLDGVQVNVLEEESPINYGVIMDRAQVLFGPWRAEKCGLVIENEERDGGVPAAKG
ncbi:MAG: hypothetical protein E7463_13835 [Ruminococcaceae bacterium]|nr:hypothetical protein [Oscillospiraceae bacterium]